MSLVMRKIGICENKDTDQLRGDREADQSLCLGFLESAISLLHKCLRGFRPGPKQTGLCSHRRWLEA